ncbi:RodZ domain-containing protein [Suttonella ornithocola]|uniref:Cytoskeleton protein rodZ n=1 Tax=Suttonella ornithocola TaxID=279832 RepID=A0A380MUA8_9GAMM|nr:RodZ domain-containing protein [Suttonella ornithocola]SUO95868.1 Cytoskeleton protein rodZ [Suttonella ornithocola]
MTELSSAAIEDIGAVLKAAREEKGISLSSAAMQTHLSTSIIDKLEQNHFREVGAPVFTRGYLTQYARFLGLDATAITDAFNHLGHENTEIRLSSANIASQSRSYKRKNFGAWLIVIPLILLAGVIVLQVVNPNSWLMTQFKHAFLEKSDNTIVGNNDSNNSISNEHEIILQVGDDSTQLSTIEEKPTSLTEATLPTLTSLESLPDEKTENSSVEENASNETNESTPELTTEVPVVLESNPVTSSGIKLDILNENWIEIRNKENKIVASKVFKKGETLELSAQGSPYGFNIGRPNDVELSINGNKENLTKFSVKGSNRRFKVEVE